MSTLLQDFGGLLGIDLAFDENDQCLLEVGGKLLVSIRKKGEDYSLYGMLGDFPDVVEGDFWRDVLAENTHLVESDDGVICLEASTDCLVLIKNVRIFQLDALGLKSNVENFVNTQERLIAQFSAGDVEAEPTVDEISGDDERRGESQDFHPGFHAIKV